MKKLLFTLLALLFAYNGYSQCATNFTTAMAPQGNNLLRVAFSITGTPTPPAGKTAYYYIYWGDASSNNVGAGTYYHNYTAPGTYTPQLIMQIIDSPTSTLYCGDTESHAITVSYTSCATSFTTVVSPATTVTATATTPAGGSPSYSWNWGDGSPAGTGNPATHVYTTSGTKTITLTTVVGSCTYVNSKTVAVSTGSSNCSGAIAKYWASGSGMSRNFTDSSSFVSGTYKTYSWSFGDGGTSTSMNPSHTYTSTGVYNVCLITYWKDSVLNTVNCTDTECKSITISIPPPPVNKIYGYILQDSNSTAPHISNPIYKIWLIRFDSTTNILSAVDSLIDTGTIYNYTAYQFNNASAGIYRVKAKLLNGPTSGTSYVPTYHTSSLMWNTATTFWHYGGTTGAKNINLVAGTATSGPGFIGGNVSAGANKGTSSGIPDVTILLMDAGNNIVTSTSTDVNGNYSFTGLSTTAYSVYPEDMGYTTTPIGVIIPGNQPSVTGLNFSRSESKKTITPGSTGIVNVNTAAQYVVYPNPAKDKVTIQWNAATSVIADISITDVTGKKVLNTTAQTTTDTELNLSQLQKGLYFINISANGVQHTQKIVLQ